MKQKHPFLIYITGSCKGSRDGCKATYYAEMLEDDLIDLVKRNTDSVQFYVTVGDPCPHVWKAKYDSVRGSLQKQQINAITDGTHTLLPPSHCAKKNLHSICQTKYAVGNH